MIYYKHGTAKSRKTIFGGNKMKLVEKKVKGNWEMKIAAQKSIVGTVSYVLYVFDRTIRQFALIQEFNSLQESKDFFNNLIKK